MLQENLIKIYEQSFRENREMAALTDYFKKEEFSYFTKRFTTPTTPTACLRGKH